MRNLTVPFAVMALSGEALADTAYLQDIVGDLPQGQIMELPLQPDAEAFADRVRECFDGDAPYHVSNWRKDTSLNTKIEFGDLTQEEAGCVITLVNESDFETFDGFIAPLSGSFLNQGGVLFDGPYPEDYEARSDANDAHVGQPQYWIVGGSGQGREGSESRVDMFAVYVYENGLSMQDHTPPTRQAYGVTRAIEGEEEETVYVVPETVEGGGVSYERGETELSNGARYVFTGVECPSGFAFDRAQYFPGNGDEELFPYGEPSTGLSRTNPAESKLSMSQIDWVYDKAGQFDAEPGQFCRATERLQRKVPSDERLQVLETRADTRYAKYWERRNRRSQRQGSGQ